MAVVEVRYLVDDFSVDDPGQVNALFDHFDASASRVWDQTIVSLGVEVPDGADPLSAIQLETARLEVVVGLRAVDVDLDLVDEGEIAERLGKSRQIINLIAKGERGRDFPPPFALPGSRRVWSWAAIARWVREHKHDWDNDAEPDHLLRGQQRELAAWLTSRAKAAAPAETFDIVLTEQVIACTLPRDQWPVPVLNGDTDWTTLFRSRLAPVTR